MTFNRIILALLLLASSAAWATSGTKAYTDKDGREHWMGISTDTKPTATTVPLGSEFIETDTKQLYKTNAQGAWVSLGNIVYLATTLSGEDQTNDVMKVEGQFSYKNIPHADTQVKASAGFVHTVTCGSDAAATAGTIILYDNTAESGTVVYTWTFPAANVPTATVVLDVVMTTGIYMGYTTTGDVDCVVSYR